MHKGAGTISKDISEAENGGRKTIQSLGKMSTSTSAEGTRELGKQKKKEGGKEIR